jgi:hypothetical protein
MTSVTYSLEDMFVFDMHSLFWNSHDWNNRTVEDLEEDAECSSGECKWYLCYFLSVALQLNCWLGWLFVEVPRSHTVRHRHTLNRTPPPPPQWPYRRKGRKRHKNKINKRRIAMRLWGLKPEVPETKPLQIYSSDCTASRFDVTT